MKHKILSWIMLVICLTVTVAYAFNAEIPISMIEECCEFDNLTCQKDASVLRNVGTTNTTGYQGGAGRAFSGSGQYLSLDTGLDTLTPNRTVCLLFSSDVATSTSDRYLFEKTWITSQDRWQNSIVESDSADPNLQNECVSFTEAQNKGADIARTEAYTNRIGTWEWYCSDWSQTAGNFLYINNTYSGVHDADANDQPNSGATFNFTIGAYHDGTNGWDGEIDRVLILNVTPNEAQRNALWNNGDVPTCGELLREIADAPIAMSIVTTFSNRDNGTVDTIFNEGENFYINISATYDGNSSVVNNAVCNVTLPTGILEFEPAPSDFTVCSSGCDYAVYTQEINFSNAGNLITDLGINDTLHFSVCHPQTVAGDLNITVNCGDKRIEQTISSEEIPTCATGNLEVFIEGSSCANQTLANITARADVPSSQRKNITGFSIDRKYETLQVNAPQNGSYYRPVSSFEYYDHGSFDIHSNCSYLALSDSAENTIVIENIAPRIVHSIVSVNGTVYTFNDSMIIEYNSEDYHFDVAISDDDLLQANHTLYCGNGSMLWLGIHDGLDDTHTIKAGNFTDFDCNPFNFTSRALDTTQNQTVLTTTFNVTDTTIPLASELSNRTITFNITPPAVTFYDANFFSYNVTCNNSWSATETGLNVLTKEVVFGFTMPDTDVSCAWEYCDGHTNDKLDKAWKISKKNANKKLEFKIGIKDKANIWTDTEDMELNFTQEYDRIKFALYDSKKKSINKDVKLYYKPSGQSYYFPDEQYIAWIVDDNAKTWFDMNGIEEDVHVFYNNGTWELTFNTDKNIIEFESIGELNCVETTQIFNSQAVVVSSMDAWFGNFNNITSCSLNTTWEVMFMALFLILLYGMAILNITIIRIPVIDYLTGLMLFVFSLSMFGCGYLFALFNMMMGILMFVYGVFARD